MGLFRKLGILMVVTSPKWSLMAVTAPGQRGVSILDQRQFVDT